jgi:chemotaxis protein MotA
MLALLGIGLVFVTIFGGYLLEKGDPWVLMQPAEFLIIGGAALGIILVANPPTVLRKMLTALREAFHSPRHTRESYLLHLRMLFEVFSFTRRPGGTLALEAHVEEPATSAIFSNYPDLLKDRVTLDFFLDSLRMLVMGAGTAHELDHLMDLDIEIQQRGSHEPVRALTSVADSLPGLGIVAAVLGVVITMQSIGGSPALIGEKVAAALVGTFLGILLCYGVVGPVASRLEARCEAHMHHLQVLRTGTVAFARGTTPILAVEAARRSIPLESRPGFDEMQITVRREARIPPTKPPSVPTTAPSAA